MATEMHWWNGSTWKKANEMYVWNGSEWKQTVRMYIWDEGPASWRLCHESAGFCAVFDGIDVSCPNCGDPDCCLNACGTSLTTNGYSSNCADPYADYSTNNCYLYSDATCTSLATSTYVQLQIGVVVYNFQTDGNGKITSAAAITC